MKSVLITGGTGAFGRAFVDMLLTDHAIERICVYSRGEFNQHVMSQQLRKYADRLRYLIGDVRDRDRLRRAFEGVDTVVHAAALKRIEVGHYNPIEMVRTNVDGSINVIEAALDAGVKRVVALSSDKAYQPISPYGLTKAMAECLFINANNIRGWHGPQFSVCRYGNVWKSTGSVVPLWKMMIEKGNKSVPITDPDCTRFFMTMNEAVDLVIRTINDSSNVGEIRIPKLPAYRLGDLAEAMGVKTAVIGLPAWEKKHESMSETECSETARRMSVDELRSAL